MTLTKEDSKEFSFRETRRLFFQFVSLLLSDSYLIRMSPAFSVTQ